MSPFIDSGIWVGAKLEGDVYHNSAKTLLFDAIENHGFVFTSTWVIDEVISHLTKKKVEIVPKFLELYQGTKDIKILDINNFVMGTAKNMIEKYSKYKLSMTDWTNIILMKEHGIKKIITVDKGFKNIQAIEDFNFYIVDLAWKK